MGPRAVLMLGRDGSHFRDAGVVLLKAIASVRV